MRFKIGDYVEVDVHGAGRVDSVGTNGWSGDVQYMISFPGSNGKKFSRTFDEKDVRPLADKAGAGAERPKDGSGEEAINARVNAIAAAWSKAGIENGATVEQATLVALFHLIAHAERQTELLERICAAVEKADD